MLIVIKEFIIMTKGDIKNLYAEYPFILMQLGLDPDNFDDDEEEYEIDEQELAMLALTAEFAETGKITMTDLDWDEDWDEDELSALSEEGF